MNSPRFTVAPVTPTPAHEENLRALTIHALRCSKLSTLTYPLAGYSSASAIDHFLLPRIVWAAYNRTMFGCLPAKSFEKQSLWESFKAGLCYSYIFFSGKSLILPQIIRNLLAEFRTNLGQA